MDTGEYNSALSKAAGAAETIGGKVKSGLATLGKVSAAAVTAAGAGVVAIGKQALDAYADFEQLSGGIETLFGDSAKKVMADASEAFKTAGMDANQYMETSIQSAAALINSLSGDQAKAADLMNMSITDMADNVNKMGTDMEAVQNAYRGFSRGNFTMLDNLALGFAGTKEGMQELLDKAEEVSGIKYDISSYSDIVEAIHVVQTEMGITGTTALEASETISGSLASMKSAWGNMLAGIADDNADFDGLVNNLVDSALTVADNLLPRIEQALQGAGRLISGLAPVLSKAIPELVSTTLPVLLSSAMDLLGTVGTTIVQTLPAVFNVVKDALGIAFTGIKEKVPAILEAGKEIAISIGEGIKNKWGDIKETIGGLFRSAADFVREKGPLILDRGKELLSKVGQTILDALPSIIEKVGGLFPKVQAFIGENAPKLLRSVGELIGKLVRGIADRAPEILKSVGTIAGKLIGGVVKYVPKIIATGISLVGKLALGLIQGIPKLIAAIPDLVKGFLSGFLGEDWAGTGSEAIGKLLSGISNILSGIGDWFEKRFKVARDAIFRVFIGIGMWFSDKFTEAKEAASAAWEGVKDRLSDSWEAIKGVFATVGNWFGEKFGAAKEAASSAWEGIKGRMSDTWEAVKGVFSTVGEWFGEKFGDAKERASTAFSAIRERMSGHWENVKGVFSGLGDWFRDKFAEAKDKAVSAWSDIKSRFSEIKDRIKSGLNIGAALDWGRDLVQNFIDGITQKWDALREKVSGLAGMVRDFIGFSEPKKGPLSNFHTYAPDMIALFIKGIRDNQGKLWKQIERTFGFDLFGNTFGKLRAGGGQKSALDRFEALYKKFDNYEFLEANVKGMADPFYAIGMSMTELIDALNASASQEEFSAKMMRDYSASYGEYGKVIWDAMAETAREVALGEGAALDRFTALYKKLDSYDVLEEQVKGFADPFSSLGLSITELIEALNSSASQEEFAARMMREYSPNYEEYSKFIWDEMAEAAREVALGSQYTKAVPQQNITIERGAIVIQGANLADLDKLAEEIDRRMGSLLNRRRAVYG